MAGLFSRPVRYHFRGVHDRFITNCQAVAEPVHPECGAGHSVPPFAYYFSMAR